MSWPTIWREILNFKFQISNFKSSNNKKNVIPAPFGLELMAEREAGIQKIKLFFILLLFSKVTQNRRLGLRV